MPRSAPAEASLTRRHIGAVIVLGAGLLVATGHARHSPPGLVLVALPPAEGGPAIRATPVDRAVRPIQPVSRPTAAPMAAPPTSARVAEAVAAVHGLDAVSYGLAGPPTISVAVIEGVLTRYGSPMAGQGQRIYDLGVAYGIDPAYCVAFFVHESAAGTRGEAVLTHSMGNLRARPGEPSRDGYRLYTTWEESVTDWYRLIRDVYIGRWSLSTVAQVIPIYAPSSDNNDVAAYIADVQSLVTYWRALSGPPPAVVPTAASRAAVASAAQRAGGRG